jgi:hypothetical protein
MPTESEPLRSSSGTGAEQPGADRSLPPAFDNARSLAVLVSELLRSINAEATSSPAPTKPLPAGTVGSAVPIPLQLLQQLYTAAAVQGNQGSLIWMQDGSELMVITGKITVALDDGLVMVAIPVMCDQTQASSVEVTFATGSTAQPAGMVVAAEQRPQGNPLIVDVWGEALTAFAWRLLLSVTTHVAAQSGIDEDGAGLVPIALVATKDAMSVLPIARHTFDRVQL